MSVESSNGEYDLGKIEDELEFLLSSLKTSDKLTIGDTFKAKDEIPFYGKVPKGTKVEIIDIQESDEESKTTSIDYKIVGGNGDILNMSKGVFIVTFCEHIVTKKKHINNKIKELRKEEKEFKNKLKGNNGECGIKEVKQVKKEINFIIDLTKKMKEKLGL